MPYQSAFVPDSINATPPPYTGTNYEGLGENMIKGALRNSMPVSKSALIEASHSRSFRFPRCIKLPAVCNKLFCRCNGMINQ